MKTEKRWREGWEEGRREVERGRREKKKGKTVDGIMYETVDSIKYIELGYT